MKTKTISSLFITSLVLIALPSLVFAQSWSGPDTAPVGDNVPAPINVGPDNQIKSGGLIVGGLSVVYPGNLITTSGSNVWLGLDPNCVTDCSPTDALDVTGNVVVTPTSDGVSAGDVTATAFYYTSDERLKENILPLQNSLSTIEKLQGVSFDWKKDQKPAIGFIAQDVKKILPQIVSTDAQGYESVSYASVVPLLVEAVKQQQQEIEMLEQEVSALKNK